MPHVPRLAASVHDPDRPVPDGRRPVPGRAGGGTFSAVGQPRNRDPRAGCAVEADGNLHFRFVTYDIERVVDDLGAIGLEEPFRQRWVRFLRTRHDPEWSREYPPQAR